MDVKFISRYVRDYVEEASIIRGGWFTSDRTDLSKGVKEFMEHFEGGSIFGAFKREFGYFFDIKTPKYVVEYSFLLFLVDGLKMSPKFLNSDLVYNKMRELLINTFKNEVKDVKDVYAFTNRFINYNWTYVMNDETLIRKIAKEEIERRRIEEEQAKIQLEREAERKQYEKDMKDGQKLLIIKTVLKEIPLIDLRNEVYFKQRYGFNNIRFIERLLDILGEAGDKEYSYNKTLIENYYDDIK